MSLRTKTISITSGKGGVGKSSLTANIASYLAAQNKKILILDGDFGMSNMDIMFGMRAQTSLLDVIELRSSLEDIILPVQQNISLLSGGSGLLELQALNIYQRQHLFEEVNVLSNRYDYLLVDTAPGIDSNVLFLNSAVQNNYIVLTADPSSLTDSYALIKVLNQKQKIKKFNIICNQVRNEAEGVHLFNALCNVSDKFLNVSLDLAANIPYDAQYSQAVKKQNLIIQDHPNSVSALAIEELCQSILNKSLVEPSRGGIEFFWQQMVGVA